MNPVDGHESLLLSRPEDAEVTLMHAAAVILVSAVFWTLGGPVGLGLGIALGLALVVMPDVLVFALGQVMLTVLLPENPTPALLAFGEVPLLLILVSAFDDFQRSRRVDIISLVLGGVVVTVSVASIAVATRLWIAVLVVLGTVSVISYGLRRYAIVIFASPDYE